MRSPKARFRQRRECGRRHEVRTSSTGGLQATCSRVRWLLALGSMDTVRLIDAVVRHTTAFIAQLSTSAGLRAPLAHIADQVFLELSREIEAQGVSRKVVASMFGMALRGYQRKVQRLEESSSFKGKTLWEAVVEQLHHHGPTLRAQMLRRFEADGEEHVAAVLRDLTDSGVVYMTGKGDAALYGLSSEQDRERILLETQGEKLRLAVWYTIHRKPQTFDQVCVGMKTSRTETQAIVEELLADGLVTASETPLSAQTKLESRRFLVPVGSAHGWEVAVFDHYRAVLDAIAAKLYLRARDSVLARYVGGTTLVFDVHDQHPMKDEVLGLLDRTRTDLNAVWSRVSEYNRTNPIDEASKRCVTFYFGQNVQATDEENNV